MHWRRRWQPTPVFLPGESEQWRSLVSMGLHRVRHDWSDLAAVAWYHGIRECEVEGTKGHLGSELLKGTQSICVKPEIRTQRFWLETQPAFTWRAWLSGPSPLGIALSAESHFRDEEPCWESACNAGDPNSIPRIQQWCETRSLQEILFIYLFLAVLGLLLRRHFSSCWEWELLSSWDVWASYGGSFSCCRAQALGIWKGSKLRIPRVRKLSWGRKWQPTPVFLLENPMDRGAWWAI